MSITPRAVVQIDAADWKLVERVLSEARDITRSANAGEYARDPMNMARDMRSLERAVIRMDGLCADYSCNLYGLHMAAPEHEPVPPASPKG